MRKDFLEIAKRHYDRMQQNYHLNTKHSVENSKVYDETKFLDKPDGKIPQIIVEVIRFSIYDDMPTFLLSFNDRKVPVKTAVSIVIEYQYILIGPILTSTLSIIFSFFNYWLYDESFH